MPTAGSGKTFTTAISDPFAKRRFIATAYPVDASNVEQIQYWSDHGLVTKPAESPASTYYDAKIKQALDFERFLFDRNKVEGRSIPSYGSLVLSNVDGAFDPLDDLVFDEKRVVIEMGDDASARADYGIVFDGTAARAWVSESDVQVRLRDLQWKFDKPMSKAIYRGMGSAILFDGTNDWASTGILTYTSQASETFECWVQADAAGSGIDYVWTHATATGGTTTNFEIRINNAGKLTAVVYRRSGSSVTLAGAGADDIDRRGTGWFHVALVIAAGAEATKLYVGGELVDTDTAPTHTVCTAAFTLGSTVAGAGSYFTGQIDDVRAWNVARTQSEIRDHMNVELDGTEAGLVGYWRCNEGTGTSAANKVSGAPAIALNAGATFGSSCEGNSELAGQRKIRVYGYAPNVRGQLVDSQKLIYKFSDSYVSDFARVFDKGVPLTPGTKYVSLYTFLTTVPAAGTFSMYPPEGLIRLGMSAAGEVTANILGDAPGKWGVLCDGVDDSLTVTQACPAGSMTLEAWCKPDSTVTATQRIFGYRGGATVAGNRHFGTFTGNTWLAQVVNDAGTAFAANSPLQNMGPTQQGDRWTHLALVLDVTGATVTLYVNGNQAAQAGTSGTFNTVLSALAAGKDANAATNFFKGGLDALRLWNVARTQTQIRQSMFTRLVGTETGLVDSWELDEGTGTSAADSVGGGPAFTLNGGALWAGGWAPDSPAFLARWIASDRAGVADYAEMDLTAIYTLQAVAAPQLGFAVMGSETCLDALDLVVNSVGAYYGFNRQGTFDMGRMELPSGSPIKTLDTTVIKSVRPLEVPNPTWRQRVGWGRCWFVQSKDALAGGASQAQRDFVSQPMRYAEQSNADTKKLWGEKEPQSIDTALTRKGDADDLAARRVLFYGQKRRMYEVTLLAEGWDLDLAEEVTVAYSRFGLDAGVNCRIIGFAESAARGQVRLYVWR